MSRAGANRGKFGVQGLSELTRTLESMPDHIRNRAVGRGTKEGAKIIQKAAVSLAPVDEGKLQENIVVRKRGDTIFDSEHQVVIRAQGKGDSPRNAFYAFFVEYGHTNLDGTHVPAKPFMRPAFEQNKESAIATLSGYIKEAVGRFRMKR